MWLILLAAISITIVTGNDDDETACRTPIHEVCKSDELPRGIPVTEAELDLLCSKLKVYIECGINMERICQPLPGVIEVAEQVQNTVKLVCDKDDQLYKDVLENLECFKKFNEDHMGASCFLSQSDEERIKTHEEALVNQGLVKSGELDRCLEGIHEMSCLALELEKKCGEVAMNASIKIALHTTKMFDECEDEVKKVLRAVIVLHKLEEEMEAKQKENQVQEDLDDLIRILEVEEQEGEGTK